MTLHCDDNAILQCTRRNWTPEQAREAAVALQARFPREVVHLVATAGDRVTLQVTTRPTP